MKKITKIFHKKFIQTICLSICIVFSIPSLRAMAVSWALFTAEELLVPLLCVTGIMKHAQDKETIPLPFRDISVTAPQFITSPEPKKSLPNKSLTLTTPQTTERHNGFYCAIGAKSTTSSLVQESIQEAEIHDTCLALDLADPTTAKNFQNQLNKVISVIYKTNNPLLSPVERLSARLALVEQKLPYNYDTHLKDLILEISPYYFDAQGALLSSDTPFQASVTITKFLEKVIKKDIGPIHALSQSHIAGAHKIIHDINHPPSLLKRMWAKFFQTDKKLIYLKPHFKSFEQLHKAVVTNPYNLDFKNILYLCRIGNIPESYALAQRYQNTEIQTVFNTFYQDFANKILSTLKKDSRWSQLSLEAQEKITQSPQALLAELNRYEQRQVTRCISTPGPKLLNCGNGKIQELPNIKPSCSQEKNIVKPKNCGTANNIQIPPIPDIRDLNLDDIGKHQCNHSKQKPNSISEPCNTDSNFTIEKLSHALFRQSEVIENISEAPIQPDKPKSLEEIIEDYPEELQQFLPTPEEIAELGKEFNEQFNKILKELNFGEDYEVDYLHILAPIIELINGKINLKGLHVDYLGKIENSGVIEIIKVPQLDKNNCYAAWIKYAGQEKFSTFFPLTWPAKKIIENIIESLKDQKIEIALNVKTKNYEITGLTSENIKIKTVINPSHKKVITSYPYLKASNVNFNIEKK